MEKATKEKKIKTNVETKKTKSAAKKTSTEKKSTTTKKKTTTSTKKAPSKVADKTTTKKSSSTEKKSTTTKKKTPTKKAAVAKKPSSKKLEDSSKMKIDLLEYYDLPYRYNQTVVKLLFQTPKTLFVYWDITDSDREQYTKTYGEHFFEHTKPVLIVHNETKNYTFEIEINDFANSWYFHVPDADCKYVIELGRRPKDQEIDLPNDYLYITSSNELDAPNDKILFAFNSGNIFYRNAKTHQLSRRDFGSITFMQHLKDIYSVSDFYRLLYGEELLQELENDSMRNPTSGIM